MVHQYISYIWRLRTYIHECFKSRLGHIAVNIETECAFVLNEAFIIFKILLIITNSHFYFKKNSIRLSKSSLIHIEI